MIFLNDTKVVVEPHKLIIQDRSFHFKNSMFTKIKCLYTTQTESFILPLEFKTT